MKTFTTFASLCLLGLLFFVVSDASRPRRPVARPARPPRLSNTDRLATASSRFAVELFMTLHPDLYSNTVLSPHSAHTALAMTMMGAKRDTENEMMNALGLRQAGLPKNRVHAAYKTLLTSLSNINGRVNLTNANGVFVKAGAHLHNSFRRGLQQSYNAKVEKFDMTHPDGPAAPINAWVSNATRGKITDLLAASDVTPSTFMILINAIYMNATWRHRFTESMTSDQPFNSVSSGVQQIPTMTMTKNLKYANHHNTEVIELPFDGNRLSMYILLPNPNSSFASLHTALRTNNNNGMDKLGQMLDGLQDEYIRLYLPKFRIQTESINLKDSLVAMGMRKAFTTQADFRGISNANLAIDKVVQKAVIEVNEFGVEAAAATSIHIVRTSLIIAPDPKDVRVDRPFMFVIRDNTQKLILFMGAFMERSAA